MKQPSKTPASPDAAARPQSYVRQADVPAYGLDEALRVPEAIADNYAMAPTAPLKVAKALNLQPLARPFRMLCGSAGAYGLVDGGAQADQITVLPLAKRILRPTEEDDDLTAKREALLRPRVFREFLQKYNGSPLPKEPIALNVLADLGVPSDRVAPTLALILASAKAVGILMDIKGKQYVDLAGTPLSPDPADTQELPTPATATSPTSSASAPPPTLALGQPSASVAARKKRVFLTHGKNRDLLEPVKKLLAFGELEPVVAADKQTVSIPVPEKVLRDMRSCGAAIIHVDAEQRLLDPQGKEVAVLNANVLIEIGASMALYGRRFILLVSDGVALPSNLQGLYEVRYSGDALDGNATVRLLEAINDIKNHPLPEEGSNIRTSS